MFSFVLFGLLASAFAAPQYNLRSRAPAGYFPENGLFDTNTFWGELSKELRELDEMLADFTKRFPSSLSNEGIEGNEYKITIPLSGFDEKDVVVKAREGLLMIQANHKYADGNERNYLDIRTLPTTVNVKGTWTFEKSTLKIVFPLKEGVSTVESVNVISTDITTRRPNLDREEVDENKVDENDINTNVDVGLDRGDQGKNTEIFTNEIPDTNKVEATTYAVDLKDEVEFVPMRY